MTIEQVFGQIKRKFPCLSHGLQVAPNKACQIIKACFVLFNLSKQFGEPELDGEIEVEEDGIEAVPYAGPLQDGRLQRDRIINRYF